MREVLIPLAFRDEVVRQLRTGARGDADVALIAKAVEALRPAPGAAHVCIKLSQPLADRCAKAIGQGWAQGRQLFREEL